MICHARALVQYRYYATNTRRYYTAMKFCHYAHVMQIKTVSRTRLSIHSIFPARGQPGARSNPMALWK